MDLRRWSRGALAAAWLAAAPAPAPAQTPCSDAGQCAAGELCLRALGQCGAPGICIDGDFHCPQLFLPACGCDGQSYVSPCEAQRRGGGALRQGACCVGACSALDRVAESDLRLGVDQGLGLPVVSACRSFDRDQSARVTIDELVTGVRNALRGCP